MSFLEETRELTIAERNLGWQVFWDTIPFEKVRIGNKLGLKDCPWMQAIDGPGWSDRGDLYILHMGSIGFKDATSKATMIHDYDEVRNTFIHELTHVWQACHGKWVFTRSLFSRMCAKVMSGDADKAYVYQPGLDWNSYNVEQQAKLVEDWFKKDKMSKGKVRYEYIRDIIRNC